MSDQNVVDAIEAPGAQDQPATASGSQQSPQPLSKNAMKKAAKQERFQTLKLERRAREKEAKKEKKRLLAEKRAAGELDEDEEDQKRKAKRRKMVSFGGRVVVDLSLFFPSLIRVDLVVSANRQANFPFKLVFSSLNGKTHERLESLGEASYKRWANSEWWTESFEKLWSNSASSPSTSPSGTAEPGLGASSSSDPSGNLEATGETSAALDEVRQKVVYLTADCEEELTELKADETYIIGGIVDHNRYKNLCLNKAQKYGVRTAKLPIGSYLSDMPTRKVLTVNQCFEILLKWVETKNWEEALYSVIPKRKFQTGTGSKSAEGDDKGVRDEGEEETPDAATILAEPLDDAGR